MIAVTDKGIFTGRVEGECVKISVPAIFNTSIQLNASSEFLDLPWMDSETLDNFIQALSTLKAFMAKDDQPSI